MEKNADLYNLTQQLQGMIFQAGQQHYLASLTDEERDNQPQSPPLLTIRGGYAESIGWMMVQLLEFDPEPLTVEKFRVRAVYSAPRLSQGLLELIASEKWADRKGEQYSLTDAGRTFMHDLMRRRYAMFANFEPIASDELDKLVAYSQRIFQQAIASGSEQSTWCLRHSQRRKPDEHVSATGQLIHVCSDFNAWRDDTHMAAYSEHDVDGMTWEAFSFVDEGQAKNAIELFDLLAYRGWTIDEWQVALNRLCSKGWIEGKPSTYYSTSDGKAVRQRVEEQTDALFYAPWDALDRTEQIDYIRLLNELHQTCAALLSA